MQTIFKYVAQFLLIPLFKELFEVVMNHLKEKRELKRLEEENKKKGEAYENSGDTDSARDTFSQLP